MTESPASREAAPYPASWIDHLMGWIERLPGPAWAFYLLMTLVVIVLGHLFRWVDGTVPMGVIEPARVAEAPLFLCSLALMQFLNKTARRSMEAFRPALSVGEAEVSRLEYELTTLPRPTGFIAVPIGAVFGFASLLADPGSYGLVPDSSTLTVVFTASCYAIVSITFAVAFVIHTVRQLRLVSRIHRLAGNINLFHRIPVYAFSALTARTGIGIVLVVYYFITVFFIIPLFGASYQASLVDVSMIAILLLLAAASFVLPLNGMHRQLAKEKSRLVAEADRRFEFILNRLHQQIDTESLEDADGLNKTLASLVIERDALARISTWPWRPETLRGFLTSVGLPLLIWLATSVLGRLLEA